MTFIDTSRKATCDETTLLLSRGLDGDLSSEEAAWMYAHVATCDACRQMMGEMAAVEMAIDQIHSDFAGARLDAGFAAELAGKLEAGQADDNVAQLRQFVRHTALDASLREQLEAAHESGSFIQRCVQLGQKAGYHFTAAQVAAQLGRLAANDDELSDEQLDRVAAASACDGRALLALLKGLAE